METVTDARSRGLMTMRWIHHCVASWTVLEAVVPCLACWHSKSFRTSRMLGVRLGAVVVSVMIVVIMSTHQDQGNSFRDGQEGWDPHHNHSLDHLAIDLRSDCLSICMGFHFHCHCHPRLLSVNSSINCPASASLLHIRSCSEDLIEARVVGIIVCDSYI